MKRIIIAFMLCFALTACQKTAHAQIRMYKCTALQSGITTQTNDSLTNTETTYFNCPSGTLNKYTTNKYAFYFVADTTSGTPVTVSVIAQGSYDGITWYNMSGMPLGTDGINCDSLSLTAGNQVGTQQKITCIGGTVKWVTSFTASGNTTPRYTYARLKFVQASGTVNLVISSVYCLPFSQ